MSNVDSWCKACGEVDLPSELQDLEDAIHHHQGIYEHITLAYSEVRVCLPRVQGIDGLNDSSKAVNGRLGQLRKNCILLNYSLFTQCLDPVRYGVKVGE